MEKINYIYINGEINKEMASSFKQILRLVKTGSITVRINSFGGNTHAMNQMITFLYFMRKYKRFKIVIEIERAESAALMLALSFPERHITSKSISSIHLPVPAKKKHISPTLLDHKRMQAVSFYSRRTKISEDQVSLLDGTLLDAQQMIEMGIATKLADQFHPLPLDKKRAVFFLPAFVMIQITGYGYTYSSRSK